MGHNCQLLLVCGPPHRDTTWLRATLTQLTGLVFPPRQWQHKLLQLLFLQLSQLVQCHSIKACILFLAHHHQLKWLFNRHNNNNNNSTPFSNLTSQYMPSQEILVVGDGDLSFSVALTELVGSGRRIIATSYPLKVDLVKHHPSAARNIEKLTSKGVRVFFGVDATALSQCTPLRDKTFDRIIFNFPHTGSDIPAHNAKLVGAFLQSCQSMLRISNADREIQPGQVQLTLFQKQFDKWGVTAEAKSAGLALLAGRTFHVQAFPGYEPHHKQSDPTVGGTMLMFSFVHADAAILPPTNKRKRM
eukprot:c9767_g2_i1.p1 GENE.c9767_g2_i1~~c9767_g2_i1.p1  ORF type:complete len:302 (-),score=70.31 c9767_g2_i1:78-983(-)